MIKYSVWSIHGSNTTKQAKLWFPQTVKLKQIMQQNVIITMVPKINCNIWSFLWFFNTFTAMLTSEDFNTLHQPFSVWRFNMSRKNLNILQTNFMEFQVTFNTALWCDIWYSYSLSLKCFTFCTHHQSFSSTTFTEEKKLFCITCKYTTDQ